MKTKFSSRVRVLLLLGFIAGLLSGVLLPVLTHIPAAQAQSAAQSPTNAADVAALQAELTALKGQMPDQAHAMADVGQHFANLWFAGQKRNWPLAKFYLDETRSHLNWAVRLKPVRKTAAGQDIDLRGILQAVENTQLVEVRKAVEAKDDVKFGAAYRLTLEACYACHKSSEKPYLRPQIPGEPESPIINFDPDAKWPD
jgi:hypothetical protein